MKRALIVLGLLFAGTAAAQNAQDKFAEGKQHYDLAEWDAAIESFKEAYRIDPDPLFLFNVAQSYRQKGDCTNALVFYKTYLREAPDAYNRDKVEKRIEEMTACAKEPEPEEVVEPEKKVTKEVVEPEKKPDVVTTLVPPPERKSRGLTRRRIGLFTGMAGVAVTSLGAYFSFRASADARDLESLCELDCDGSAPGIQAIDRRGKRNSLYSGISLAVGGALLAAGVGIVVWDQHHQPRGELTVAPTQGGATVQARVTF